MGLFKHLEGETAIVVESGVFKQADLYVRDGGLFAKTGGGFVRLCVDGSTSKTKCRLDALHFAGPLHADKFGRLCDASAVGSAPLEAAKAQKLLLGAG